MKLIINAVAMCTLIIGASNNELTAQEFWGDGYSASCDERGGCHRDAESYSHRSIELIPYRQYAGRNASYQSNRLPYHAGFGYGVSNYDQESACGHGGTCNKTDKPSRVERGYGMQSQACEGGRCPYERSQHENHSHGQTDLPSQMHPGYGSNYDRNNFELSNNGYSRSYSAPALRQPEYRRSPADDRPQLRGPAFNPQSNFAANSQTKPNGFQSVPPTSSRITAPPQLPPQPNSGSQNSNRGNGFQSQLRTDVPQLLPPTDAARSQSKQASDDHSEHDHSGHDHASHNHDH